MTDAFSLIKTMEILQNHSGHFCGVNNDPWDPQAPKMFLIFDIGIGSLNLGAVLIS